MSNALHQEEQLQKSLTEAFDKVALLLSNTETLLKSENINNNEQVVAINLHNPLRLQRQNSYCTLLTSQEIRNTKNKEPLDIPSIPQAKNTLLHAFKAGLHLKERSIVNGKPFFPSLSYDINTNEKLKISTIQGDSKEVLAMTQSSDTWKATILGSHQKNKESLSTLLQSIRHAYNLGALVRAQQESQIALELDADKETRDKLETKKEEAILEINRTKRPGSAAPVDLDRIILTNPSRSFEPFIS